MKTGYILVGPPGCGKSTLVKRLRALHTDRVVEVFSQDWCYEAFMNASHAGQWWSDLDDAKSRYRQCFEYMTEHQKEFDAFMARRWAECLSAEVVVVDRTNLTRKSRARWINDLKAKKFRIVVIEFMLPLQTLLDRQVSRPDKAVPLNTVKDMYLRSQQVLLGDECDDLIFTDGSPIPESRLL